MSTPTLQPITPSYRLRILSDEQLMQLKSATLEILEDIGFHCPSPKALAIYAEHGANVNFDSQVPALGAGGESEHVRRPRDESRSRSG